MPRRGDSSWAEARRGGALPVTALALLVLALLVPGIAGAESPDQVAAELAVDGVYVAPGRTDIDETSVAAAIDESRALGGLRLVAVAPNDPQPDAEAFARRVQEASDADAAIVFPPDGGFEAHVIDKFEDTHLRAVAAGRATSDPVAAVEAFSTELLREPDREFPPIIRRLVLFVLLLAVVLVLVVAAEQYVRRNGPGSVNRLGRDLVASVQKRTQKGTRPRVG